MMITSEPRVGPTEASSGRLLVLEVTSNPDAKVLRVVDLACGRQLTIALCEDWMSSDVKPGDIVRIILTCADDTFQAWDRELYENGNPILVTSELNFFVHHPDTLVSATAVADSFACLRKAVISHRTPSGMPKDSALASEAAVFGTLIHDMFQVILASDSNTRDYSSVECVSQTGGVDTESFFEAVEEVLYRNYESLYAAKVLDQNARLVLHKVIPNIIEWYKVFMGSGNYTKTLGGLIHDGKSSHRVTVKEVHDIEELIWSPVLGLKGKIDASVLFRVDGVDTGVGVFELKTGNSLGYSALSHSAQTELYTLLMSDRNSRFVKHGLLTYMQYREALKSVLEMEATTGTNTDKNPEPLESSMTFKTMEGGRRIE
ncbi:DNA replication factor Dna2 [Gracilaria domingensis]|nr:DNA replication factor Dna2 [Gracilaria domingensis]